MATQPADRGSHLDLRSSTFGPRSTVESEFGPSHIFGWEPVADLGGDGGMHPPQPA